MGPASWACGENPRMVNFRALCPNGHATQHWYYRDRLEQLVGLNQVTLWCIKCDTQWYATKEELDAMRRLVRIRE